MSAQILDGKAVAAAMRAEIKEKTTELTAKGIRPGLGVILVGDDPASRSYVTAKEKACEEAGILSREIRLPASASKAEILTEVAKLNAADDIHGILVQLPLPDSAIEEEVLNTILPEKDVDGFHPMSVGRMMLGLPTFLPCTPHGILHLLKRSGIDCKGKHVVVVGRSNIVGKPLANLLSLKNDLGNATVTLCHTGTPDIGKFTRDADIVIAAVGRPEVITADMIREGAVVVDVGVNRVEDASKKSGYRLVGDCAFAPMLEKASAITPVPGGVGPMTITMLLYNTLESAEKPGPNLNAIKYMQTVHRYILRDYLVNFLMALAVITLVLYLGAIMRGLDYVAKGVPGGILLLIFTLNIPYILTFSIPISTVVSTLLLFGRLSLDGEFTAMRSGGLSTWQIISPVVLGGTLLSLASLFIQYEIAPESRFARRQALANIGELDPVDLLDEGQFVRFPTLEIYITKKDGNFLEDVEVYELNEEGQTVQTIRAQDGQITVFPEDKLMRVKLNQVQVQHPDAENPTDLTMARIIDMETYEFNVNYRDLMDKSGIARSIKDMRGRQLTKAIRKPEEVFDKLDPVRQEKNRMKALVEYHKRIGLSMACLSFTLVGIPLGMTSKRKESNLGIPIGLSIVILFYAFILTADSLRDFPWLFPDYIIWIPILATQIGGVLMIRRIP